VRVYAALCSVAGVVTVGVVLSMIRKRVKIAHETAPDINLACFADDDSTRSASPDLDLYGYE